MKNSINLKIVTIFLFAICILVSCKKEIVYQLPTGELIGYVVLRDEEGVELLDHSGVEVVIEGSSPQKSAISDKNGKYVIENLQTGTYNILYSKPGFGSHKDISYMFVGGNQPSMVRWQVIYRLSAMKIENLRLQKSENLQPYVELRVTADISNESTKNCPYLRCFVSNSAEISYLNYISSFIITHNNDDILDFLLQVGTDMFPIGSELYMIIYPSPDFFNGYNDIDTDVYIYTGIEIENASNVASIIIPEPDIL